MAEVEKVYTIPLRVVKRLPRTHRAERAIVEVRKYIARHMKAKSEDVWLDNPLNEAIWARGMQKPPSRIRVKAVKFDDGVVEVSLPEE
jgi:large subunit ribosomal protein L31e